MSQCQLIRSLGDNSSSSVSIKLRAKDLASVSFSTYLSILRLMLARADYQIVRSLGRRYLRSYKPSGGADLIAAYQSVQGPIKVLVQLKQESRKLQRRYIDELRGKMLRTGVSHGLVITLGVASKPALAAASEFPGRPISIIGGEELAKFFSDSLGFRKADLDTLQAVRFASQGPNTLPRRYYSRRPIPPMNESCANDSAPTKLHLVALGVAFIAGLIFGVLVK